ncbi:MAG: hypothetical protein AAF755_06715 [Pseudomonadota bacterium]
MRFWLAMLAFVFPCTAWPQSSIEICNDVFESVATALISEAAPTYQTPDLENGTCRFFDLRIELDRITLTAETLTFRVVGDVAAVLQRQQLFDGVEIKIHGLRYFARTGLGRFDYVYEAIAVANTGVEVKLSVTQSDGVVILDPLQLDFDAMNSVKAAMRVTGVSTVPDLASLAIEEFSVEVLTHGLFERTLLTFVADAILGAGDDAWVAAERWRERALTWVAALPSDRQTRRDLSRLVNDMPNPTGRIVLRFGGALPVQELVRWGTVGAPSFWADTTLRYTPQL